MKKTCIFLVIGTFFLSANLATAALVNINARSNSSENPIELFLEAGTYSVEPIGIADGGLFDSWIAWVSASCTDPNGCPRTVPTTVTGWLNIYDIASPYITDVSVNGIDLTPTDTITSLETYFLITPDLIEYSVNDGLAYPTALSALSAALDSEFTLSSSGIVEFYVSDYPYALVDNSGGISLKIDSASEPGPGPGPTPSPIPEPGSLLLLGFGISFIGGYGGVKLKKC